MADLRGVGRTAQGLVAWPVPSIARRRPDCICSSPSDSGELACDAPARPRAGASHRGPGGAEDQPSRSSMAAITARSARSRAHSLSSASTMVQGAQVVEVWVIMSWTASRYWSHFSRLRQSSSVIL